MKYNTLSSYINERPVFYHEEIKCPFCDTIHHDLISENARCDDCGYLFLIRENGTVSTFDDPFDSVGMKETARKFLSEEISRITRGESGWKSVVATYHDPLQPETFDIFWSMTGSNVLFKNGDKVDLKAAAQTSMAADQTNKTQYHYDPNIEKIETTVEIKSIINKYNLDSAGYSVSSFVISPDGTKVFSGAPIEAFDTGDAKPFFAALKQCIKLKGIMKGRYAPDPDTEKEKLQMAINTFIDENPLILSLPTGNNTPDEVGHLSDYAGSGEEEIPMEAYYDDIDFLIEAWANRFIPTSDDTGLQWPNGNTNFNQFNKNMGNKPTWTYGANGKVYASQHTAYRMVNQRIDKNKTMSPNDPRKINMTDIDNYVNRFYDYIDNIFPHPKNETKSFLYYLTQYGFPLVAYTIKNKNGNNPILQIDTMNPYRGFNGNFDYRVTDDVIINQASPKTKYVNQNIKLNNERLKKAMFLVDMDELERKCPKNLKGKDRSRWISKHKKIEAQKIVDEYGEQLDILTKEDLV